MPQTYDEVRTPRLLMRRWTDADREPFAAMNADPEVMRYFPQLKDRAASDAGIDRFEETFENRGFGFWVLETLSDGSFIGFTELSVLPEGVPAAGEVEIGWRLVATAWHQGYATEAARAAVDLAFGDLGLVELWSMTTVLNWPSRRVMQRIGMTYSSSFEHPRVPVGSPVRPHVMYHLARPAVRPCGRRPTSRSRSRSLPLSMEPARRAG